MMSLNWMTNWDCFEDAHSKKSVKRKSSDHFCTNDRFNSDANNKGDTKFISILMPIKID